MVLTGALLLAAGTAAPATAQGTPQQKSVTGRVTSEQGEPLGGVSVVVKGTTTGTMTRVDGTYSLRAAVEIGRAHV